MKVDNEYWFIPCDRQLPPTECPLVIELPPGTRIYGNDVEDPESYFVTTDWYEAAAHRINHIETKDREIRFELGGIHQGLWVVGRPSWTYP